jgi:hypothetical protein
MPINNVPGDSLGIALRRWRVMEVEMHDGSRSLHVWGHDVSNGLGRASSPIVDFNSDAMSVTTISGRNYQLIGLPGNSRLGKHAWIKWCSSNGVVAEQDVTSEYLNINQLSTAKFKKINYAVS